MASSTVKTASGGGDMGGPVTSNNVWWYNGRAYDARSFMANHPGGFTFIAQTQGTDITDLFDMHHIRDRAYAVLSKYEVPEDVAAGLTHPAQPPGSTAPVPKPGAARPGASKNTRLAKLKKLVAANLDIEELHDASWSFRATQVLVLAATVVAYYFMLGVQYDAWWHGLPACIAVGILSTSNAAFGHNGLHCAGRRPLETCQMYLSLYLNPLVWQVNHCLNHHGHPNHETIDQDREVVPLSNIATRVHKSLFTVLCMVGVYIDHLLSNTLKIQVRWDLPLFARLVNPPVVMVGALWMLSGDQFWTHMLYTAIAGAIMSGYFLCMTSVSHLQDFILRAPRQDGGDCGLLQLQQTVGWDYDASMPVACTWAFLNLQPLHHLLPTIHHSKLYKILPYVDTVYTIPRHNVMQLMANFFETSSTYHTWADEAHGQVILPSFATGGSKPAAVGKSTGMPPHLHSTLLGDEPVLHSASEGSSGDDPDGSGSPVQLDATPAVCTADIKAKML